MTHLIKYKFLKFSKFYFSKPHVFKYTTTNAAKKLPEKDLFCIKDELIKLSLLNVNKYGWTEQSIKVAANELGYSSSLSSILENGALDLIYFTMDNWLDKLKLDIKTIISEKNTDIDEKFIQAIKVRLSYEYPFINTWSQAMRIGMSPKNIQRTFEKLFLMIEEILSIEEDKNISEISEENSSSPSRLTARKSLSLKRYILLKIFLMAELHMLTDKSHNFIGTHDFINKMFSINFGILSTLNNFEIVSCATMTLIKYSLISLAPYDFSQIEEILKRREELNEDNVINSNSKF